MNQYKKRAQQHLFDQIPEELERLKQTGKKKEFLNDVEEHYKNQEDLIIKQMTKDQPEGSIERAQQANRAKMVAQEVTNHDFGEFLKSL